MNISTPPPTKSLKLQAAKQHYQAWKLIKRDRSSKKINYFFLSMSGMSLLSAFSTITCTQLQYMNKSFKRINKYINRVPKQSTILQVFYQDISL